MVLYCCIGLWLPFSYQETQIWYKIAGAEECYYADESCIV